MNVLVLNAGSSSLKFHLFSGDQPAIHGTGTEVPRGLDVDAIGHRIVHGGDRFTEPVVIDAEVERAIDELCDLAPLHNPHSLAIYRQARERYPKAIHVAVFDTAFHRTIPERAATYALPSEWRTRYGIHRYGFHGISHQYIASCFPDVSRLIVCHLGNGCSVCAIQDGKSVDTSMGFTPLEGLIMGTRSGDVDPGALLYLLERGVTAAELSHGLNFESGLLGLSGTSSDMRDLERSPVVDLFAYRVKKYIGAYFAALNGADALVFTGGIGENSPMVRARICEGLTSLGIELDPAANARGIGQIGFGKLAVHAMAAGEELLIRRETERLSYSLVQPK